jgi:hypothetical protein
MDFDPSRLRRGELIAGAGAPLLLAFVFVLPWFGRGGGAASLNGWQSLTSIRWLMLLCILAAMGLFFLQATRPAPALPVTMSLIVTVLGGLSVLALIYRVLINVPGPDGLLHPKLGAFLGLITAGAIAAGGFLSMRQEGLAPRDARTEIRTVTLGGED